MYHPFSHSSYNFERDGLDTYEKDFIDDSQFLTPLRRQNKIKRGQKTETVTEEDERNSDSSDCIRRTRHTWESKRHVLCISSSDSEGETPATAPHLRNQPKVNEKVLMKGEAHDTPTDSDEEVNIVNVSSSKRRKRKISLNLDSDEENSDNAMKRRSYTNERAGRRKKRPLKQPASDDEIRYFLVFIIQGSMMWHLMCEIHEYMTLVLAIKRQTLAIPWHGLPAASVLVLAQLLPRAHVQKIKQSVLSVFVSAKHEKLGIRNQERVQIP